MSDQPDINVNDDLLLNTTKLMVQIIEPGHLLRILIFWQTRPIVKLSLNKIVLGSIRFTYNSNLEMRELTVLDLSFR